MSKLACSTPVAIAFVNRFKTDASIVAMQLRVPVENILGLAAEESQYGQGRVAKACNNYFSMHAPAPLQTGTAPVQGTSRVRIATYASFRQSGQSFAARFGFAVKGKVAPEAFAQALMQAGYNSGDPRTGGRAGFSAYLVGIISAVRERLAC